MPPPPPTPWTHRGAATAQPKQQKQQQHHQAQPTVVSPAVKALQTLISHLQHPPRKSAPQGCFCQSRTHTLSPHTPQCLACGLVLCSLNPPFHPCPSAACAQPLLTAHARSALVAQLHAQVAHTLADEDAARRARDGERARAVGAFPQLGPQAGTGNHPAQPPQPPHVHKVLSVSGKGKVTATYTRISPSPSSTSIAKAHDTPKEDEVVRVPPPLEGPEYDTLGPSELKKKRLFENLRGEGPVYVPLPREAKVTSNARGGPGRRRRPQNKGKKRQEKENQPQLLEAGPSSNS